MAAGRSAAGYESEFWGLNLGAKVSNAMSALASFFVMLAVCSLAQPTIRPTSEQHGLYLHFFAPAYGDGKDSRPPRCIITAKIHPGEDFDIRAGTAGEQLTGSVDARDGKFHARLRGSFGTSTGDYDGDVELEKEVSPKYYGFSGAICMTFFVLSTNSDCAPFLANHGAPAKSRAADMPSQLMERKGDKIVNAPPEDLGLARTYPMFPYKGALMAGQRITIMTAKTQYKTGESIRVLHILESVREGVKVYVMGPKTIYDEYIDGKLATAKGPGAEPYDGLVLDRPTADFNYNITTYTFPDPCEHTIQWKGGGHPMQGSLGLESNIIRLKIVRE
jgi:hypothetical protein